SRRRHTRSKRDWSSDVCSSDLILNWSFVHDDVPRFTVQNQIALALRKEVEALEENGIQIIQVDEPALREGLPLDQKKWQAYLDEIGRASCRERVACRGGGES